MIDAGYDDDECDGSCIERPHLWQGKPVCQREGCRVMGTGDRCGDGECEGRDLASIDDIMHDLAALVRPLTATDLGKIMLREAGVSACRAGYQTTDPHWVGVQALSYGDINPDGTLN